MDSSVGLRFPYFYTHDFLICLMPVFFSFYLHIENEFVFLLFLRNSISLKWLHSAQWFDYIHNKKPMACCIAHKWKDFII